LLSLSALTLGCDSGPPVKTSTGEAIEFIAIHEQFALSTDVKGDRLHGERLRKALEIMERTGAFAVEGDYAARGVVDKTSLTVTVRSAGGRERSMVMKNCAEPKMCAFLSEAHKAHVIDREPAACKSDKPCEKK
jgi:hypothetical protein